MVDKQEEVKDSQKGLIEKPEKGITDRIVPRETLPKETPQTSLLQQLQLAEIHKRSMQIGTYAQYGESCPCCDRKIPAANFGTTENNKPLDFYKFGIDFVNYHIFTENYILLLSCVFISYFVQFCCSIIFNGGIEVSNKWTISYIELNYQELLYHYSILVDLPFVVIRLVLCLNILFAIKKEMKKATKQYRNLIYDYHIDESAYAVFVKNVPYLTDLGCLIEYLNKTYNVNVAKASHLDDFAELAPLYDEYKTLLNKKTQLDFSANFEYMDRSVELTQIDKEIISKREEMAKEYESLVPSKTVLITFEKMENKNLFFRKLRDGRRLEVFLCCCKEPNFRGNKLYFECINGIEHIDWANTSFSLEKGIKESQIKPFLVLLGLSFMSIIIFLINSAIFATNQIYIFDYNILDIPLLKSLLTVIFNELVGIILSSSISSLRIGNDYFKQVLMKLMILHKTFINSVVCYLYFYDVLTKGKSGAKEYSPFIQLIFVIALKSIIFALFPMSTKNLANTWKYLIQVKCGRKKKFIQEELNEICQKPEVNILDLFSNFRILVYCGLILVRLYPIWGALLFIVIYITKYVFKYTIYNHSVPKVYFYGFFFKLFFKIELVFLLLFNLSITYIGTEYLQGYNYISLIVAMDLSQVFQFVFSFNDFFTEKTYSESQSKFIFTFEKDNIKRLVEREIFNRETIQSQVNV